jgi:hypothetical protein
MLYQETAIHAFEQDCINDLSETLEIVNFCGNPLILCYWHPFQGCVIRMLVNLFANSCSCYPVCSLKLSGIDHGNRASTYVLAMSEVGETTLDVVFRVSIRTSASIKYQF